MVNAGQIVAAFRDVASTKSLSPDEVNDLIKDGILAGLARIYGPNVNAEIEIDESTGEFEIVVLRRVVEEVEDPSSEIGLEQARWDDPGFEVGDVMEIPVDFTEFGRNAVMAVKQRIVQRVREGERQRIREEYADRVGELLSGEVQQIERGKVVVMLNRSRDADAIIPWKEQNPRERFRQGDPIRAVLKKVEETPKGPRLILSRADPLFVAALFGLEVPEIYHDIVEIRRIAREVGGRTKIAVSSRDESIDPVGACVGLKGSRVQAVVSELGGERIDIVPWHPDSEVFARRALAPARVAKVMSSVEQQVITAIVDEDQLSLAIGRNGQNVRLASQLIGWQIDLYGSREWLEKGADLTLFGAPEEDEQLEMADFPLGELSLEETTLAALETAGYNTFLDIIDLEKEDLGRVEGLSEDDVEGLFSIIDELTVTEGEGSESGGKGGGATKQMRKPPPTPRLESWAVPTSPKRSKLRLTQRRSRPRPTMRNRRTRMMATREGTEALQLLGLARRAGAVVAGVGRSREAVRAGRAALVLVAADASDGQRSKIERISRARTIPLAVLADRTELGAAVGEPPLSALVVLDAGFGHRILGRIQRREASGPASRTSIGGTNE